MSNNSSIQLVNWYSGVNYSQYNVTQGLNIGNVSYPGPVYISTIPNNNSISPSGVFIYPTYGYSRQGEVATIYFTTTGATPSFARGSQVAMTGIVDQAMNFTGMLTDAMNGASQGTISFTNAGPDVAFTSSNLGTIRTNAMGAWTSGWLFTPGYAMNLAVDNNVNKAQFESSYAQRQTFGLNSNLLTLSLSYENRTDKEVKAMLALEQVLAGVYSTPVMLPPVAWCNNPTLKFILTTPKVTPKSYNISDVTVIATQVYEQ